MLKRLRHAGACLALATAALAGCGDDPAASGRALGDTLSVYLSVPRHGDSARRAAAVAAGARLALRDAGGEADGRSVRLVTLDSSDSEDDPAGGGGWDPEAVLRNARRAVSDPTAVAYIGELDHGGSAVSVPITNDAGLLQVSPSDGLTSLTRALPGAADAGPARYYPSGKRNFLRLVPTDFMQASTLVQWARLSGARRLALVHDGAVFGRDLASQAAFVASCEGLAIADPERVGTDITDYEQLAERVAARRPDAVVYAGAAGAIASRLAGALEQELPSVRLFGAGGVAAQPSTRALTPNTRLSTDREPVLVTRSARPARSYPRAGRRVLRRLAPILGRPVSIEALYGYEAMSVVLDALASVAAAGSPLERTRAAVRRRALRPRTRHSVLGTYRVSAAGDVSELRFGGYTRESGALRFEGIHRPAYRLGSRSRVRQAEDDPCSGLLRIGRERE